jgi:predicted metalloprotease with PDZ domain
VDIGLKCQFNEKGLQKFMIPAWRPGRYQLTNYAGNIRGFSARDHHGDQLLSKKVSRNCWQVSIRESTTVDISYQYYAYQLDAGGSVLDEKQLYLNFINCLVYLPELINEPCLVNLQIDPAYKIACGLAKGKSGQLLARDYYQLVDSPMIASPKLKHWKFQKHGVKFHLWFQGSHRLSKTKTVNAFKSFASEQIQTMGQFPESDYHFLFQVPQFKLYHGVEHHNSTVIALGPGPEIHKSLYLEFLGVSSHELFHSWNIKRIRPKELLPYNFNQEVYFDTGFIAEGVTTYYGDLFLVRSGVIDHSQYFKELNKLFKRHFENEGRHHASLVESSRDLWVDGYGPGAPDRKVSIYTKGALVSMMLDLLIRSLTSHHKSLDHVMRALWLEFGDQNAGYTLKHFQNICEQVAGQSLVAFFEQYIQGVAPLEEQLKSLLHQVGCTLKTHTSKQLIKRHFGFRVQMRQGQLQVVQILADSPAYQKLSLEDVIVSVNGKKPTPKLNSQIKLEYPLKLDLLRQGRRVRVSLLPSGEQYFNQYKIERIKQPTDLQQEGFRRWLGKQAGKWHVGPEN